MKDFFHIFFINGQFSSTWQFSVIIQRKNKSKYDCARGSNDTIFISFRYRFQVISLQLPIVLCDQYLIFSNHKKISQFQTTALFVSLCLFKNRFGNKKKYPLDVCMFQYKHETFT